MSLGDPNIKKRLKTVRVFRFLDVGTRNDKAQIAQHLSDAAHPDAADADKMNSLYVSKHSSSVLQ